MTFNNSNITKFLVLFIFVGFLLGIGFAAKSCNKYANLIDPNYGYNEHNEDAPPLSDTCQFVFNYDGWNTVNGYRLEWASNVSFTFRLIDNSQLIVGFDEVSNIFGGEGEEPIGYEILLKDKSGNEIFEKSGVIDLAINDNTYKIKNKGEEIITFKVKTSAKEDVFFVYMTPNIKSGIGNCLQNHTFNAVGDSCILNAYPEKIILQQINPSAIITFPFTTSINAKQGPNTIIINEVQKDPQTTIFCISNISVLEKNNSNNVLTAKNEPCLTSETNIEEGTCENVTLTDSFKCDFDQKGDFVQNNILTFANQTKYDTEGVQYLNNNAIVCDIEDSYAKNYYKVIDKNVFVCNNLTAKISTEKNLKCENLESGSYEFADNVLRIGTEGSQYGWSVINVGKATSVYVKEEDVYYKKTKDVWQKCTKSDKATTPKEDTKSKGNGVKVKNMGWAKDKLKKLQKKLK